MSHRNLRLLLALSSFIAGWAPACAQATNSLSAKFELAGLPSTITLCRDPAAIQAFGVDEQWQLGIDVDNNASTGAPPVGVDVIVAAVTMTPAAPCTSTTANTADSLAAGVFAWSDADQMFMPTDATATVSLDFVAHTITINTDLMGALSGLTPSSKLLVSTVGAYQPSMGAPTVALDGTSTAFHVDEPVTLPANDVQGCASTCSPGAPWYPLVDLVGMEVTTAQPLSAFGSNTMYVEFDLATLPTAVDLCRYPTLFAMHPGGIDSQWLALFNPSGADSGDGSGGYETLVAAYTTPQAQGCSANSAPMATSVSAELDKWDAAQQNYVMVATLPVSVDVANGKIIVQADRSAASLAGLSAASLIREVSGAAYLQAAVEQDAYDLSDPFGLGASFTDPAQDVLACTAPCSTAVSWYSQIDLVGGSVHLVDEIFENGFDS